VIALEGFDEVLSNYYKEQKIGQLWRQVQPIYSGEIERLHDAVSQIVFLSSGYLREMLEPAFPRRFTIVVEPLVGRITNVRNFGEHYAVILSGANEIPGDVIRHAFLHFLLDPLPLQYAHTVAVKRPLYEMAAKAPRLAPDLKDDFPSYFAECTVRAVELKLKRMSPSERESAMDMDDANGYVLVRPLFLALPNFEKSEPAMKLYFPDWVRAVDTGAEAKRIALLKYAAPASAATSEELSSEEVARARRSQLTTVPNDSEVIADLTEGERQIAEKNARAAEVCFQKVLAKYPDQHRAWYGLGLVALLDHDGARAKQVFGRLTAGDQAATQDPMVMAWSHIYLARIYEDEGQAEVARTEYQAALNVPDGPQQSRLVAQKGLTELDAGKAATRP